MGGTKQNRDVYTQLDVSLQSYIKLVINGTFFSFFGWGVGGGGVVLRTILKINGIFGGLSTKL